MNPVAASSPTARDDDNNDVNYRSIGIDLSLKDFDDEDLSDILHDKDFLHSYANASFKIPKKSHHHFRYLNGCGPTSESSKLKEIDLYQSQSAHNIRTLPGSTYSRRPRPTSLRLFTEPARPAPLPLNLNISFKSKQDQHARNEKKKDYKVAPRVKASYSDETIKNNNAKAQSGNEEMEGNTPTKNNQVISNQSSRISFRKSDSPNVTNAEETKERRSRCNALTRSASEWSIEDPETITYCFIDGEMKEQTHKALFKFFPRHQDEIQLEINDPIHVADQADDFWFEGVNMRSGKRGIFPAYYAQSLLDDLDKESVVSTKGDVIGQFNVYFLGSVEVPRHKGNDLLCQAMHKVAQARRSTLHELPPAFVCILVSSSGIKMLDQSLMRKRKLVNSKKQEHYFSSSSEVMRQTHYFRLQNVSFCGHHPKNDRYFAFVSRHPQAKSRFACHVFVSENSTRPLAESVGKAFAAYYKEFLEYSHPVEDIYIE